MGDDRRSGELSNTAVLGTIGVLMLGVSIAVLAGIAWGVLFVGASAVVAGILTRGSR